MSKPVARLAWVMEVQNLQMGMFRLTQHLGI